MPEIKQNNFLAGALNDPRSNNPAGFWYSENMEVGKRKSLKQVVNNAAENACASSVDYCIAKIIEVDGNLYGLGQVDQATHHVAIYAKTAALTGDWAIPTNGGTSIDLIARDNPFFCFIYPYIYFVAGGFVGKYDPSSHAMTDQWNTVPVTGVYGFKGGISWNGKMYGWYLNNLCEVSLSDGTVTALSLAIGTDQEIVDCVPYQDGLMIVCNSLTTVAKSKTYFYDGATVKPYGVNAGTVFGAAYFDGNFIVAAGSKNKKYIYFYAFNGVHFRILYTYSARENAAGTYAYIAGASKLKIFGNYIYFIVTGTPPSGAYAGYYEYFIARFGREDESNPLAFSIFKTLDFTSARGVDGSVVNNDFLVIESIVGGASASDRYIAAYIYSDTNKTTFFLSTAATYSAQAGVVQTFKIDGRERGYDSTIEKTLQAVAAWFAPLPSGASVTLKYRVNETLSWATIFTANTQNTTGHSAVNVEATGDALGNFYDAEFRIELLGGAELIGWKAKYEPIGQANY